MSTVNSYQAKARATRTPSANCMYAALGLPGEVGEVCSLLAKAIRDGIQDDFEVNMKKELGDVLWFIAAIADDCGLTLEEIAKANIYKLASRQARGVLGGSGDNR